VRGYASPRGTSRNTCRRASSARRRPRGLTAASVCNTRVVASRRLVNRALSTRRWAELQGCERSRRLIVDRAAVTRGDRTSDARALFLLALSSSIISAMRRAVVVGGGVWWRRTSGDTRGGRTGRASRRTRLLRARPPALQPRRALAGHADIAGAPRTFRPRLRMLMGLGSGPTTAQRRCNSQA
jgi:hypothetical protein